MLDLKIITQEERVNYMFRLTEMSQAIYRHIMSMKPDEVNFTTEVAGHLFSTVDSQADIVLRGLTQISLPSIGHVYEESELPKKIQEGGVEFPALIADVVEGSFNATRSLRRIHRDLGQVSIQSGTALMLLEGEALGSTVATAYYDWHAQLPYSCFRGETGSFIAVANGQIIDVQAFQNERQNDHWCAIVPSYSNRAVAERIELESKLWEVGIRPLGGTQSSAQDLLHVLFGEADAYVDIRALFPPSDYRDECLRAWDVGAILPILDGCGIKISTPEDQNWQGNRFFDKMSLIVARQLTVWHKIREVIGNLSFVTSRNEGEATLSMKVISS